MERLDKLLAATGRWSRKESKLLIKTGRVKVDGSVAVSAEEKVELAATVTVDGAPIATEKYAYLMLHKPQGVVSSTEDPREQTVLSLLPEHLQKQGLFPVGRLDKDTEGLLLLTNDGALAHRLLSPSKHIDKVYYVEVEGMLTEDDRAAFSRGITLKDGTQCLPAELTILEPTSHGLVQISEGKYHQVKRMLASRKKPVCYLKRLAMGELRLDETLPLGTWRPLTAEEMGKIGATGK